MRDDGRVTGPQAEADDESGDEAGPQDDGAARKPRRGKRRRPIRLVLDLAAIVVVALVLSLTLKVFVVQVYAIPSSSMENTLMVGDRVLVDKLAYHLHAIHRGDVIVFSGDGSWGDLGNQPTDYIKRVIGLPGDRVACCTDGDITINGVPVSESSFIIPAKQNAGAAAPASQDRFSVTVPPGRLWVMGDNRSDSDDSMLHYTQERYSLIASTIPRSAVVGEAFFVIWPFSHAGNLPGVRFP